MRGNPSPASMRSRASGSIPACAGEPLPSKQWRPLLKVYPRVCGGTDRVKLIHDFDLGLSPRVRGNHFRYQLLQFLQRSIPACAGEPRASCSAASSVSVYPRVCGGTFLSDYTYILLYGLSPRVRGNRCRGSNPCARRGSIPACAGEPRNHLVRRRCAGVYPRVCGGTSFRPSRSANVKGLSPRVRGNLDEEDFGCIHVRSIPACAGEPVETGATTSNLRVYPRVCGGTSLATYTCAQQKGLSPRVRGNLFRYPVDDTAERSIPACAGEPSICGLC